MTGVPDSGVRNVLVGHSGNVVQAGHIEGGVHFHGRVEPEPPHMVPPPTPHFTNQSRVLRRVDDAWAGTEDETPHIMLFKGLRGSGKRTVGRQWLKAHAAELPDGQFHADLTGTRGSQGLESVKLREFLIASGVADSDVPATAEGRAAMFRSLTKGKRVAVCVDQALTPSQVRMLAPGPGRSVMLVTAAEDLTGLGIGERVTPVDLEPFDEVAARELVGRLIGADRVEAEPDEVGKLIEFCDGLPIALCVAGALLAEFPRRRIARLVASLDDNQRRLAVLSPNPELSVAAVFDTAYDCLGETEQLIYQALGAHPGTQSVTRETLARVLRMRYSQASEAIDRLIVSGLVTETTEERLSLHSLVRLHASNTATDEFHDDVRARFLGYYHAVGVAAGHAVLPSRGWRDRLLPHLAAFDDRVPEKPMTWLAEERANLLAAAEAAEESGKPEYAWELAIMLWPLHERGKHFADLATMGELGAVAAARAGLSGIESLSRIQKGFADLQSGYPKAAAETFEHALTVAETSGVEDLIATAVESLGLAYLADGDEVRAGRLLRRNLALAEELLREAGTGAEKSLMERRRALARMHLGKVREAAEATELLFAAREWFARAAKPEVFNVAKCDLWLGITFTRARDFASALSHLSGALDTMRGQGRHYDEMLILTALGDLAAKQGDDTAATDAYERASVIAAVRFPDQEREIRSKVAAVELSDSDGQLDQSGTVA
ncbi:hypothetical protein BAY61_21790 [Prauserella marina]|uniref:Uncharacterized protein n=1 Tax=Prauserella marina TaxID=530584 RepID=A0A222VU08_9PSEU|nr:hypothetical protein [Prauserella marina]ASR37191.1 hypothetical protein BAY61_21790 [Prauserella marina]PWV72503.1 hypothetical protein DES30_110102 [Prauserella marina]SDD78480.1 hypothetical protein SAMN05421630_112136 [Prauserella marina]